MWPYPKRIVSLAAEGAEILDLVGAFDRLVGVSGFTRRPTQARALPKVGGFATPDLEKVLALEPELVITTSDIQAEAAAFLVKHGIPVLALNAHSLNDVWRNILLVGAAVGRQAAAEAAVTRLQEALACLRRRYVLPRRVRVFFEEWPEPLVTGIGWVSDLIEYLGGEDIFRELHDRRRAPERVVSREEVARRTPEVVIASWCGRKAKLEEILARPEWQDLPAVKRRQVYEIPSDIILQTGPSLIEGATQLAQILHRAAHQTPLT